MPLVTIQHPITLNQLYAVEQAIEKVLLAGAVNDGELSRGLFQALLTISNAIGIEQKNVKNYPYLNKETN